MMRSDDKPTVAPREWHDEAPKPKRAMVSDGHEDAPLRAAAAKMLPPRGADWYRETPEALKVFVLRPIDPQEPPFHFTGTAAVLVVAAESEEDARDFARREAGGEVWADPKMAICEEVAKAIGQPGVFARDMGG